MGIMSVRQQRPFMVKGTRIDNAKHAVSRQMYACKMFAIVCGEEKRQK